MNSRYTNGVGLGHLQAGRRTPLACALGLTVLAGTSWLTACVWAQTQPAVSDGGTARPARQWKLVGVGSCTAAGCHGGGQPDRIVGSEYNVWIAHDPHARAYSTLFDERSREMVELLNASRGGVVVPAHEDPRCLACHSLADGEQRDPLRDVVTDGVGCEACHGPAEGWLAAHFEPAFATADRDRLGFWNTDSLLARTQACVRCHVGGPERDVNHELIAAGHPRLQFEMGAYHEAMPNHWLESEDRQDRELDFDALLWAVGQACTSQAALEQLARRADVAGSASVWPEFAEWSCSACHHDLRFDAPRPSMARGDARPGRLIDWDGWNHFVAGNHAQEVSQAFRLDTRSALLIESALAELAAEIQKLNPDRQLVANRARTTAAALGQWAADLETAHLNPAQIDPLAHAILAAQLSTSPADWDSAAQTYNGLASLHQARLRYSPSSMPVNEELTVAIRSLYVDLVQQRRAQGGDRGGSERLKRHMMGIRDMLVPVEQQP